MFPCNAAFELSAVGFPLSASRFLTASLLLQHAEIEDPAGRPVGVGLEPDGHLLLALGQLNRDRIDLIVELLGPVHFELLGGDLLAVDQDVKLASPGVAPPVVNQDSTGRSDRTFIS